MEDPAAEFGSFDTLLEDLASNSPGVDGGGEKPADGGQPGDPNKADGSPTPGAEGQSTAKPGEAAPDQGAQPGKEAGADPQNPPQGSLPEHLKPFESTLSAKGWDLQTPEGQTKAVQAYVEAEKELGKRSSESALQQKRYLEVQNDFLDGPTAINRRLESMGLPALAVQTPEERLAFHKEVVADINTLLTNDDQAAKKAALERLNQKLYEPMEDMRAEIAANKGRTANNRSTREAYESKSATLFNERVSANAELSKAYDAVFPLFQPGGVLHSFGIDQFAACSSLERAQAFEQIGQALNFHASAYNPDGTVREGGPIDAEVKKALAVAGRQQGAANPGGKNQPPAPASNGQPRDAFDDLLGKLGEESL